MAQSRQFTILALPSHGTKRPNLPCQRFLLVTSLVETILNVPISTRLCNVDTRLETCLCLQVRLSLMLKQMFTSIRISSNTDIFAFCLCISVFRLGFSRKTILCEMMWSTCHEHGAKNKSESLIGIKPISMTFRINRAPFWVSTQEVVPGYQFWAAPNVRPVSSMG